LPRAWANFPVEIPPFIFQRNFLNAAKLGVYVCNFRYCKHFGAKSASVGARFSRVAQALLCKLSNGLLKADLTVREEKK
jgi:hypothetical protein